MTEVNVNTPSRSYKVIIGSGLLKDCGELSLSVLKKGKIALITDDKVDSLYGDTVTKSLEEAGFSVIKYAFPNGEQSKTPETYIDILNFLVSNHVTRSDSIVALGGGVVGDMAGFVASTYLRGVKFIQIPTTLLAAVDSSVGGKTAIDLPGGKNQAGSFYQPSLVICDCDTLKTLPDSTFSDGSAEIIKYGVIWDNELFNMLKNPIRDNLEAIIARCVSIKRDVVTEDERDTGIRQILNFGHTFGHGVEKESNFTIPHGKGVAIGMAIITRACVKKGICSEAVLDDLLKMIESHGLPTKTEYSADILFNAVLSDKKRMGGNITLILPREIGKCEMRKMPTDEAKTYLEAGIN